MRTMFFMGGRATKVKMSATAVVVPGALLNRTQKITASRLTERTLRMLGAVPVAACTLRWHDNRRDFTAAVSEGTLYEYNLSEETVVTVVHCGTTATAVQRIADL